MMQTAPARYVAISSEEEPELFFKEGPETWHCFPDMKGGVGCRSPNNSWTVSQIWKS